MTGAVAGTVVAASMLSRLPGRAEAACGMGTMTGTPLDPLAIPKYVNELVIPPVYDLNVSEVKVDAAKTLQQILPLTRQDGSSTGFGPTTVFAYGGIVKDPATGASVFFRHSPGATFLVTKGRPTNVEWINNITGPHFLRSRPDDPLGEPEQYSRATATLQCVPARLPERAGAGTDRYPPPWRRGPVSLRRRPGCLVHQRRQGRPQVHDEALRLPQRAGSHQHVLPRPRAGHDPAERAGGPGRLLYHSGPQGRDRPAAAQWQVLAAARHPGPLVLRQDECGNNELAFPNVGVTAAHPYWSPEFFGDTIMVNGHTWPFVNVDRGQYRLSLLNGSNARFYNLFFDNGMPFIVIGSDGGYLQSPAQINSMILLPGSRAEILVDFSNVAPGTEIIMRNNAAAPFPDGDPADPDTVGQIIMFKVGSNPGFAPRTLPALLNPTLKGPKFPTLGAEGHTRILTLNEQLDPVTGNPLGLFLNGQMWDAPVSEIPKNNTTENWFFVNLSADAHPMHLHLVQFQIVSRQDFDKNRYLTDWLNLNRDGLTDGMLPFKMDWETKVLPFEPYLIPGTQTFALPEEKGWKDVIRAMPNQVTQIRVRFKKQDGRPYEFDPSEGPGYVWHCHIVDHEDNEMMRPMLVKK